MQVLRTLYNIDTRGLGKINQDNSYFDESFIKNKEILELKKKFDNFSKLLNQNREIIRGKGKKLKIVEIEKITNLSKSCCYRIKAEIEIKGAACWKYYTRQSTKPNNFRKSKISDEFKNQILEIRKENPTYSKSKINAILKRDFYYLGNISDSSVGRALKELRTKSLLNLKPNRSRNKGLKIESNTKPRNFEDRHSQPWEFEKHFIGNENINKKDKNNETKQNKLKRLKKKNRLIENKAKLGELIQIDHLKVRINDIQMYENKMGK